jgi:hypothetical protein
MKCVNETTSIVVEAAVSIVHLPSKNQAIVGTFLSAQLHKIQEPLTLDFRGLSFWPCTNGPMGWMAVPRSGMAD